MGKKLTKDELKVKKKVHEKKAVFYQKKIDKIDSESKKIGFKY